MVPAVKAVVDGWMTCPLCPTSAWLRAGTALPQGLAAVGWRIGVFSRSDATFYPAEVKAFDAGSGRHRIAYEEGAQRSPFRCLSLPLPPAERLRPGCRCSPVRRSPLSLAAHVHNPLLLSLHSPRIGRAGWPWPGQAGVRCTACVRMQAAVFPFLRASKVDHACIHVAARGRHASV